MELTQHNKKDFMKKAAFIADKSSCNYKVGCVGVIEKSKIKLSKLAYRDIYVRDKKRVIYVKTWNETLTGEIYCKNKDKEGCVRENKNLKGGDYQIVCSSHAEISLIAKCAKYGIPTYGMVVFVTNSPCYICAKALIQAGIKKLYYMEKHTEKLGLGILTKNGVKHEKLANIF